LSVAWLPGSWGAQKKLRLSPVGSNFAIAFNLSSL
jgi:hypothetical protein